MKVLAFFDHDPGLYGILPSKPTSVITGGYKRFTEIAKRIGEYDVQFTVIESCPVVLKHDSSLHYSYREFMTPALKFANARLSDPWLVAWRMASIGKELIREKNFDLILSPSESLEMCLAAFLTSHNTKIPWVAVIQAPPLENPPILINDFSFRKILVSAYSICQTFANRKILYYLYNKASIICVSHALELILRDKRVTSDIHICGNGISIDEINEVESKTFLYDGIFVGRFVQSKGILETFEVFRALLKIKNSARFAFVGGGDETLAKILKEKIRAKNLEKNIDILGYVEEKKKFELIKASKILIYPTHVEGWGIVVGEALACGTPVLCYDLPPFKEIFNCEAVRMCKEGDIKQMITDAQNLLRNGDELSRLSSIGREFAKKFDWTEISKKEAQIYRRICSV